MIRRECYDVLGFYDERLAQLPDFDFWVRLCMKYSIHLMPEFLIKFRIFKNDANISARKPGNLHRAEWEYMQILRHYLSIKGSEELIAIFPLLSARYPDIEDDLIPFYIAQLALEADTPHHRAFALDALFRCMGDAEIAALLEKKHGFRYADLIRLTGGKSTLPTPPRFLSSLFIDTGSGFSAPQSRRSRISPYPDSFALTFNLAGYEPIRSIRWDPVEGSSCKVRIDSISWEDASGTLHAFNPAAITTNGTRGNDGTILFKTADPQCFIPLGGNISSITIKGILELHSL